MTVAGFLIALGGSVLLISAVSLFVGTIIELASENTFWRTGDLDLPYDYDPPEVDRMYGT